MVPAKSIVPCAFLSVTLILGAVCFVSAQTPSNPALPSHVDFKVDYPKDQPGVFIQSADWLSLASVMPTKSRAKGLFAASLSYGAIPANLVAEYEGLHASTQIQPGRPVICLCHMISLPGNPVIVRLQPKKNSRELDGGKMTVKPIVEGSKIVDAKKSDLIPVEISQPESTVWLVRPQEELPAGEYALIWERKTSASSRYGEILHPRSPVGLGKKMKHAVRRGPQYPSVRFRVLRAKELLIYTDNGSHGSNPNRRPSGPIPY